uniref:uncharacterized protein LOC124025003 n=1 Tax=Oncorhynchus gorbuscha TaxID=8017 RepID=UPI001EAF3628|nr:uncharacterized protein LOC124025003 [Oncorhynchus gorbuscha]
MEDDIFRPNFVASPSRVPDPSPSHSPISEFEEEDLLPLSLDPSFSTTSRPSQSLGSSHTPSSNLTSMTDLEEGGAAKMNTELAFTSTTSSAAPTTVRMNSDIEGSGLGFMPQSSTTVAAPAGEEDQTYNSRVDKPLIETKTIIQGSNRLALPREEPAVDTSTVLRDAAAVKPTPSRQHDSYTSGWLIIVAFVAGVAVLVVICVAIGTRDRWNAPAQASEKKVANASSGDEKVEREMERFLSKERPRENIHAGEYTVILLEDLPEKEPLD